MLGKLIGALIALALAALGAGILAGAVTKETLNPANGAAWMSTPKEWLQTGMDKVGVMPLGGILIGVGLVILVLTMRGGSKDNKGKGK